jgi:hypothetical protein
MAIQISGTTVIDNSRNITNGAVVCGTSAAGDWIATQAEAEAGTNNDQVMTPLRVAQAISALGGGMVDDDINWSACSAGCAVRGGGNVIYKQSNIIWIVAPSTAQGASSWPMGYCNGDSGASPNQAQRITGRSGWFIPDVGMLQTAYTCRSFWDTYFTCSYWSSSEFNCYCGKNALGVYFGSGGTTSRLKYSCQCVRPFRVVCY